MLRLILLILSLVIVVGLMPATARAESAVSGKFVFTVEAEGKLLVEPKYISYTPDQTVEQALKSSGHVFTYSAGLITAIDGVTGNYTCSDQNGGYNLGVKASEITHFCFSERSSSESELSEGLLQLMTSMAEYREKEKDTQAAAKKTYENAKKSFVGIDSNNARTLAYELDTAISNYEKIQNGEKYKISFTDGTNPYDQLNYPGVSVTAENTYGKLWENSEGTLALPEDTYTIWIRWNGLAASFRMAVTENAVISKQLYQKQWLDLDAFRLSGSYGEEDSEFGKFSDDEFLIDPTQWKNRTITVPVRDSFSGGVYSFIAYSEEIFKDPQLSEYEKRNITAVYTMQNDAKTPTELPLASESLTSSAYSALAKGSAGNIIIYRISCELGGCTYYQDYTVRFVRIPTLTDIRVTGTDDRGNPVDQAASESFSGMVTAYTYNILNTVRSVVVTAETFHPDYTVTVHGQNARSGVTVDVPQDADAVEIDVLVSCSEFSNTYKLTLLPGVGKTLTFLSDKDVSLQVTNKNGMVMPYTAYAEGENQKLHKYVLVSDMEYSYIATYKDYYHATDTFELADAKNSQIQIDFKGMEDWLSELSFGVGGKYTQFKGTLPLDEAFSPSDHYYRVLCSDVEQYPYVWLKSTTDITKDKNAKVQLIYRQISGDKTNHGAERKQAISSDNFESSGQKLNYFLMSENPIENTLTIRLSKTIDGVLHYQDYVVDFARTLTLGNLSAESDGSTIVLQRPDGELGFLATQKEYDLKVSMAAKTLNLQFSRYVSNRCYGEEEVGYRVKVDGVDVTEVGGAVISLDGSIETQVVTITVENEKAPLGTSNYTLNILKSPPVWTSFDYAPEHALLNIREVQSGERLWPDQKGKYQLCEGYSYEYALTQYGYVSRSGTLIVTQNEDKKLVIQDGQEQYWVSEDENGAYVTIDWELEAAKHNESLKALLSKWPNFRGNDNNNAVTDAPVPYNAEEGTLYWANKLGDGYDANAVGSPILVDGDIITYSGATIFRIDTMTGEVKQTGTMDHNSSFSITPPTYWKGMVFVALSDGCVQAFNASTLESLWIYKDPLGGQPNCPITVRDGYLYTGFWKSETADARFVCLSVTDEDPASPKESKCASWFYTAEGGFYWAGAYVGEDFVLVGTDDGTSLCTAQTSSMLLLDAKTGAVLDRWNNLDGDIRSTVVYDTATDAYYFTSKGGTFYSMKVSKDRKLTEKWTVKLNNDSSEPPMSTCSPAIYNGRAYIGVSGSSQFGQYSGHSITVMDLRSRMIAYRVPTQGYPQTSGLLTTAYGDEVYVYFFDNYTPGKLRVIRDIPGQTTADRITVETVADGDTEAFETAYALFTPCDPHAEYAICSPITDEYGTIYFKNDSAHMMAFGSAIKKIEVTTKPDKLSYVVGEIFDPAGMVVTATYANGKTRDVTPYVSYSSKKLTEQDASFTISFDLVEYHNEEDGQEMNSGVSTVSPFVNISLDIAQGILGDVDKNGIVNAADAQQILEYEAQNLDYELIRVVADVSGDGVINSDDAVLIIRFAEGKLDAFPAETVQPQSIKQKLAEETETASGNPQQHAGP